MTGRGTCLSSNIYRDGLPQKQNRSRPMFSPDVTAVLSGCRFAHVRSTDAMLRQHCKKRNGSWKKGWKRGRCDVGTWPLQMMEWEGGGGNVSKLLLLLCAKVRNYYRRDRSGTAAGPQNVGIPTIPGCRRDRSRRRRDHFTCKFIGAGPHTPFGNYNNIPGGVR